MYYACWVAGTTIDANVQKEVYRRDPAGGNIPLQVIVAVVGLFVVAAALLWASSSDERVSVALIFFLVVNVFAWRILVGRVNPIISATAREYEQASQFHRLEQLQIIRTYITGWWQWARFAMMAVIVLAANVLTFSVPARSMASQTLRDFLPDSAAPAIPVLLPVAALCCFIFAAEAWIWVLRVRNAIALNTIDELAKRYNLTPQTASQQAP